MNLARASFFMAAHSIAATVLFAQATPTAKQAPPPGIAVPEAEAAELREKLAALEKKLATLEIRLSGGPGTAAHNINAARQALTPDVTVFHKAADYALQYGEFFKPQEIAAALGQLDLGLARAKELAAGKPAWTTATGPQVLGYRSKIDGSVQPYGLIVPADWKPGDAMARPLYLWFHGRGETLSEVAFIAGRMKGKAEFAPAHAFELHLYGRWCNASKFAGEVDAFEALADVQRRYAIDPERIVVGGFSMGGATAWHLGAHHAGRWAAVTAGAGFAETQEYARIHEAGKEAPPWWEEVLYRLYNATDVAANFFNVPVIAYAGEKDRQIQSSEVMAQAMARNGLKLERLIGPGVEHNYEPATRAELARRLEALVAKGREQMPPRVRFQTYTLRYHQMEWVTLDALERHWERAEIDAELVDEGTFRVTTKGVTAFTIQLPPGPAPLDKTHPPRVVIDEQELVGPAVREGWTAMFRKTEGKWTRGEPMPISSGPVGDYPPLIPNTNFGSEWSSAAQIAKRHGLQGPIDDAFMDSFIFVRPTGKPLHDKVGAWAQGEMERAIREWRTVFRGDARVKDDTAITAEDVAGANLVLWGDPGSNTLLARLLSKLPIQWTKDRLTMGAQSASAADHAPIFIHPNPLNAQRYVVVNSGFTFRQGATTSNSLQTPKLPDWALIDLRTPPGEKWPGQVVDAGFFDERWQWPP